MKKISDLFKVEYGVNINLSELVKDENGINYVGRSKRNNGVTAKVQLFDNILPNPANTISVSGGGSVLEAFVQEESYYSGRDLFYLKPIEKMNINTLQFYCYCIKANRFKYSFGRQANKTLPDLLVPSLEELPEWVNNDRKIDISSIPDIFLDEGYEKACWYLDNIDLDCFEKEYSKKVSNDNLKIDFSTWNLFDLAGDNGIFHIDHGKRLKTLDRVEGDYHLITAGANNQGVAAFIEENHKMKLFSNCITIDMFGNVFYHPEEFYCDDNIVTLHPKIMLNKYVCMFITVILNMEDFRYSFGRQYRYKKYTFKQKVYLPSININGKILPDYEFMEKYIKSQKYSSAL